MNPQQYKKFAYDISEWYRMNQRDLPFRKTKDPYCIFLSEMMLQQTQVKTMLPYYDAFIKKFPTINDLANAHQDEVLTLWQGLGYYRRARFVHEAAQQVQSLHGGVFPSNLKAIKALKGIGDYTAGAIHSIAFNQPTPAIDGNVMRVMSRVLGDGRPINEPKTVASIKKIVSNMIVHEKPSDFTQALMELGALVCKNPPRCEQCPIRNYCFAYKHNKQSELPVKATAIKKVHQSFITFLITYQDQVFLIRNPKDGLLANMLACPQYEGNHLDNALAKLKDAYRIDIASVTFLKKLKHVFTHRVWHMHVYQIEVTSPAEPFYPINDLPHAISRAHQKVLQSLKK